MIYESKFGKLLHGNCINILKQLEDNSIGLIFADPPYNTDQDYDEYKDKRSDYKEWCREWFTECRRVAWRLVITPGLNNIFMWPEIERPYAMGIWYKPNGTGFNCLGNQKYEPYYYWAKQPYNLVGGNSVIVANNNYNSFGAKKKNSIKETHPCPKPELFMEKLLKQLMKTGWTVLDPFAGTGTTCYVAEKLHMKWIGIELSENYCDLISSRIKNYYNMDSVFAPK